MPPRARGISTSQPAIRSEKKITPPPQPELPYGASILPALAAQDPTDSKLKALMCLTAGAGLAALPFFPTLAVRLLGVDGSWDASHGVRGLGDATRLARDSLGLSDAELAAAAWATAAVYGALTLADALSARAPALVRWPARCVRRATTDRASSPRTNVCIERRRVA